MSLSSHPHMSDIRQKWLKRQLNLTMELHSLAISESNIQNTAVFDVFLSTFYSCTISGVDWLQRDFDDWLLWSWQVLSNYWTWGFCTTGCFLLSLVNALCHWGLLFCVQNHKFPHVLTWQFHFVCANFASVTGVWCKHYYFAKLEIVFLVDLCNGCYSSYTFM